MRINSDKQVVFKSCALFTNCISEISITQIDNAKNINVLMSMYNLTKYSDNCWKKFGSFLQGYKDEPTVNNAGVVINFPCDIASFKFKQEITGEAENNDIKMLNK